MVPVMIDVAMAKPLLAPPRHDFRPCISGIFVIPASHCRDDRSSRRYATVLDREAGQSASVDVAFATTGETPATMSAGSVRKEPPPATALSAPPTAAAMKSQMLTGRLEEIAGLQDGW